MPVLSVLIFQGGFSDFCVDGVRQNMQCPLARHNSLGKIIITIPKGSTLGKPQRYCRIVYYGLDHVYQGRQSFRVLNVIAACSYWKCGCSRYDQVVPGVLSSSCLGQSFSQRNGKKHDKTVQSEGRRGE